MILPALSQFDFHARTRIVFAAVGAIDRLGKLVREYGGTRALVVSDPGVVRPDMRTGHEDPWSSCSALPLRFFDRVVENPTTGVVEQCTACAREERIDCLIGLGGGSSMDTAKGCNFLLTNGGRMEDYWGAGKASRPMLPMVAVPTTAGTGSECQSFAFDFAGGNACEDGLRRREVARPGRRFFDPLLTLTQPHAVASATGIDALAHAIESAVTRCRNPISQMLSREAFRLGASALRRVLAIPPRVKCAGPDAHSPLRWRGWRSRPACW